MSISIMNNNYHETGYLFILNKWNEDSVDLYTLRYEPD